MPITEMLTDEQAALIWSGQSASIAGLEETSTEEPTKVPETKVEESVKEVKTAQKEPEVPESKTDYTDDDISNALRGTDNEEEDEDKSSETSTIGDKADDKPTKGRKPSDLVSLVNEMVEAEEIEGYEQGPVKTIEEAKELFKANIKKREELAEEGFWQKKVENYSPQIQAILHYAEQGGRDITTLMGAISQVEKAAKLGTETEEEQVAVMREVLSLKGFDEEEIREQIDTLKDLDKLKSKAEKFLPELTQYKQHQVQRMIEEEKQRTIEAQEASKVYLTTIHNTLQKDKVNELKLQREDKAKIFEALAFPKYRSLSGVETNGFVKTLEELQFGKNQNYDHFLNIVHLTVDPEGFFQKVEEKLQNKMTAETVKKLKTSKSTVPNTEESYETKPSRKNVITKSEFRNPFL